MIATPTIIDRSPCGTGTSDRVALRAARGEQGEGDVFTHERFIGSTFRGWVERWLRLNSGLGAVIPAVEGKAWVTGRSTHIIDPAEPYATGFLA